MKKKKFVEGGSSFVDDFEAAKKTKALADVIADKVTPVVTPVAIPKKSKFQTAESDHPMIDAVTRERALGAKAPRFISKGYGGASINPDRLARKDILNQFPESKKRLDAVQTGYADNPKFTAKDVNEFYAYADAGYKSGGKVKSASSRADGCAIRGKTRA